MLSPQLEALTVSQHKAAQRKLNKMCDEHGLPRMNLKDPTHNWHELAVCMLTRPKRIGSPSHSEEDILTVMDYVMLFSTFDGVTQKGLFAYIGKQIKRLKNGKKNANPASVAEGIFKNPKNKELYRKEREKQRQSLDKEPPAFWLPRYMDDEPAK